MKAIVLRVANFQEKDAIITLLSENGVFSIYGKSYKSIKSKYHILNNIFVEVELNVVQKGAKYWKINECHLKNFSYEQIDDYDTYSNLLEISKLIISNELNYGATTYNFLTYTLEKISAENYEKFLNFWLIYLLKLSGYKIDFTKCYNCKKKTNLLTINFSEHSLVCKECHKNEPIIPIKLIKVFKNYYDFNLSKIEKFEKSVEINNLLKDLALEYTGLKIK